MTEVCFLSVPLRTPLAYDPCFKGEQNIQDILRVINTTIIFTSIYTVLLNHFLLLCRSCYIKISILFFLYHQQINLVILKLQFRNCKVLWRRAFDETQGTSHYQSNFNKSYYDVGRPSVLPIET